MFSRILNSSVSTISKSSSRGVFQNQVAFVPIIFQNNFCQAVSYENILSEKKGAVGVVTLNRPKALNALCDALMQEVNSALKAFDDDKDVGCIILNSSTPKALAAGADIKEMEPRSFMDCYMGDMFKDWNGVSKTRKPVIAVVTGYALGGGCELAMMCDIIVAGESAKFGQPEITLGTIPGGGGTQRLTRAIGKSKAMELILTGGMLGAHDAEKAGLVSKVVPDDEAQDAALKMATKIASFSKPAILMCKEAVNKSYEHTLEEGLTYERRLFHSTFATKDQKIGMKAFREKNRTPAWEDQ